MRKLVAVGAVAVIAVGLWNLAHRHHADERTLWDRKWVDHEPRDDRDFVHEAYFHARAYESDRSWGSFSYGSEWRTATEKFDVQSWSDKLDLHYRQDDRREELPMKLYDCHVADFDYCLELGAQTYYSKKAWGGEHSR